MTCEQCSCGTPIFFNCAKDKAVFCDHCGKKYSVGPSGKLERTAIEIMELKND